jgi:hypothetical protein|tara:strand:+ start:2493 stop:2717 length:225 start_codon:yes stop_codon:yes gene_type:complete
VVLVVLVVFVVFVVPEAPASSPATPPPEEAGEREPIKFVAPAAGGSFNSSSELETLCAVAGTTETIKTSPAITF